MTLIGVLVVPMIILGAVTFALIIVYMHRVARVTAELEARKKQVQEPQPDQTAEPTDGSAIAGQADTTAFADEAGGSPAGAAEGISASPDTPGDR